MQLVSALLPLLVLGSCVLGHMNIIVPIPRGHQTLPGISTGDIDYSITSPAQDLCQGKKAAAPVQTIKAGEILQVKVEGGATHNGGYFQFSISYDHSTWIVIHTTGSSALRDSNRIFPVAIPKDAPSSSHAVFHWSWINASGNREYYSNCADVKIEGSSSSSTFSGKDLLIVNILGHPTIDEWGTAKDSQYVPGLLAQRVTKTCSGGQISNGSAPKDGTKNYQINGSPATDGPSDDEPTSTRPGQKPTGKPSATQPPQDTGYPNESDDNTPSPTLKPTNTHGYPKPTNTHGYPKPTNTQGYPKPTSTHGYPKPKPTSGSGSNNGNNQYGYPSCSSIGAQRCGSGSTFYVCAPYGEVAMNCPASLTCRPAGGSISCA